MRWKLAALVPIVLASAGVARLVLVDESRAPKTPSSSAPRDVAAATPTPVKSLEPVSAPALETRSAPAVASAVGREAPKILPVEEGSKRVSGFLVAADRSDDVLKLTGAIAGDPDMKRLVEADANRLLRSPEPALRARAAIILAGLGSLDPAGYERLLRTEPDPAARAAMVANLPKDAGRTGTLLDFAANDSAASVRGAAVGALPATLTSDQMAQLARILDEDHDASVRRTAALWFRGARPTDPAALRGLVASATGASEDREVRRTSVMALMYIEERTPGTLAGAGSSLQQLDQILAQISDDKG